MDTSADGEHGGAMSRAVSIAWPAPAKLNLFLHITGRRADGYHLLQTVFQFLDHGDSLDFHLREDGRILRPAGPSEVPVAEDLVIRAATLLKGRTGAGPGVDIHLRKTLPLQAGLGGGSSDAATTLVALNRLWGTGLRDPELAALGWSWGRMYRFSWGAGRPGPRAWVKNLSPWNCRSPGIWWCDPACQVAPEKYSRPLN